MSMFSQGHGLILKQDGQYPLSSDIHFFVSHDQELELMDILPISKGIPWQQNNDDLNFGFGDGVYWLRISLLNQNYDVQDWALEFPYSQLDQIETYLIKNNEILKYQLGGDQYPFSQRAIQYPHTVFPLHLDLNEEYELYIRVKSSGSIQLSMIIWQWQDFIYSTLILFLLQGLFFGFVIIMAVYNLMTWISKRETIFLNYVIYIISFAIFQSSLTGIGFQFLWPEAPEINQYSTLLSLIIVMVSFNYFIVDFFDIKNNNPKLLTTINSICYVMYANAILCFSIPYFYSTVIITSTALFNIVIIIIISVYMLKTSHTSAKYFAYAWGAYIIGAVLLAFNKFGIIPSNYITDYTLQFGAGIEIMVLSLALADKLTLSQKEASILTSQVMEERERTFSVEIENLRLQKEANQKLEELVEERTKELTQALKHLSIAHDKLQTISITDALTELHNRYYFNVHYKIEYKRAFRDQTECSLIILDVDHFKKINDTYGHPAGDLCLKQVASVIRDNCTRETDICCRYGGEEFAVILPSTSASNAASLANNIRLDILKLDIDWQGKKIKLSASFGVSSVIPTASDEKHRQYLINQADHALYQAKNQGRNTVVSFNPEVF